MTLQVNRSEGRPEWATRLRQERKVRHWTQEDVVRAMRAVADRPLPEDLLTSYKRYERGRHFPTTYTTLLAVVFGTDVASLFGCHRPTQTDQSRELADPEGEGPECVPPNPAFLWSQALVIWSRTGSLLVVSAGQHGDTAAGTREG